MFDGPTDMQLLGHAEADLNLGGHDGQKCPFVVASAARLAMLSPLFFFLAESIIAVTHFTAIVFEQKLLEIVCTSPVES